MAYTICPFKRSDELFVIETDRLRLAVLKRSAYRKVYDYVARNREFHQKFAQTHSESYFTLAAQKEYLDMDVRDYKRGRIVPLWIMLKGEDPRIIGRVSYFNIARGGMMLAQVGYHLDEQYTGKGYMTEALTESARMMFELLELHRIEAFILPENQPSLNLIKRCGYTYEGVRHSYMSINGRYRDHETFYMLRP